MVTHLSWTAFEMIGALFSILLLATLFTQILKYGYPHKFSKEVAQRINSWWMILGLFSFSLAMGKNFSIWFLAFVSFLGLKEYLSMIPTRRADHRVLFWAYICIPLQYYFISLGWYNLAVIFIPIYGFTIITIRTVILGETAGFLKAISTIHWGLLYTVFAIGHLAMIYTLEPHSTGANGASLLLFVVVMVQLNDVSQWCFGKAFGKRAIVPKVSPKKTVAGLLGAMFFLGLVSYFVAPALTPLNGLVTILVGLLLSLFGFLGDISISAVKRDLKLKDSGNWIPGHGGILDRIDSLIYTAHLFFHFVRYFYY